jgi:hypothetical protein
MRPGYRGWSLGVLYLAVSAWMAWVAGPEHIGDLGGVLGGLGLGVAGSVAGRGVKALADKRGAPSE